MILALKCIPVAGDHQVFRCRPRSRISAAYTEHPGAPGCEDSGLRGGGAPPAALPAAPGFLPAALPAAPAAAAEAPGPSVMALPGPAIAVPKAALPAVSAAVPAALFLIGTL